LECEWSDYAYDKMAFQCYMFRAQLWTYKTNLFMQGIGLHK
jgi:hypothetical protein